MTAARANVEIVAKNRLQNAVDQANKNLSGMERHARNLTRVFGGLTAAFGARELVQAADKLNVLENRLRIVTDTTAELNTVQERLFDLSQRTRSSFEGTVELYARVARSSEELGLSQGRLIGVVETINQAIQVSGATAVEAQAGLIQFSQGLASGALRGDELRSVLEQMPRLARAIADGLGVTIGELRELGTAGELSAKNVIGALESQAGVIRDEFGQMDATVGQAVTNIGNSFLLLVGKIDDATGATDALARAIQSVSQTIDDLATTSPDEALRRLLVVEEELAGVSERVDSATGRNRRAVEQAFSRLVAEERELLLQLSGVELSELEEIVAAMTAEEQKLTGLRGRNRTQRAAELDAIAEREQRLLDILRQVKAEQADVATSTVALADDALQRIDLPESARRRHKTDLDDPVAADAERRARVQAERAEQLTQELEQVRQFTLSREQVELEAHARRLEVLRLNFENKLITEEHFHQLSIEAAARTQERITQIQQAGEQQRQKSTAGAMSLQITGMIEGFAQLATISAHGSETLFKIGKTAAIANALVNTYTGVTQALKTYPPPASFAWAAAVLAKGLAQVSAIRSQSFSGGGGGGGGAGSGGSVAGGASLVPIRPEPLRDLGRDAVRVEVNVHGSVNGPGGAEQLVDIITEGLRDRLENRDEVIFTEKSRQASVRSPT